MSSNLKDEHVTEVAIHLGDDTDEEAPLKPVRESRGLTSRSPPTASLLSHTEASATPMMKLLSALGFAVSSIGIQMIVKAILTEWDFHCVLFVGLLQYTGTALVLLFQRNVTKTVSAFPISPTSIMRHGIVTVFPLPLLFLCNTLSGLAATKGLSMPNFVMLRRLSIVMTMVLERVILNRVPSNLTVAAVMTMVLGAGIAAGFDNSMPFDGVFFVLVNDVLTALLGVALRKKMDEVSRIVTTEGILFYNNIVAAVVTAFFCACLESESIAGYPYWSSPVFLVLLASSSVMGFVLNYFNFFCTKVNSPLTTAMVGASKNVISSYIGMFFKDYVFSWYSILGLNVSVLGTLLFSWSEWKKRASAASQ